MDSLSEELRKKRFELNRLVDPTWAGGKFGAPGIGGEEVLYSLLPTGIGVGGRAVGAGVRGFNAAAKKLDPLADFISSPSGRQMLDSMGKTWIFNKLAKEIENRYGVGSQPWVRQEEKRSKARGDEWKKKRQEILGDFLDSMPHHKEKSQKVANIGMGSTIRNIRQQQAEERKRKEWALTILDQFKAQGASKKQIDNFIEHSGVAFNPDRESKVLHDAVLGAKEVEQYYPNPEKAGVVDFPLSLKEAMDKKSGTSDVFKTRATLDRPLDGYPVDKDYRIVDGNQWTIGEVLKLREEDPEAFSLLMDEYFWNNLRARGRSPEVERKFFENKKELEYYGSPPGTMMKLPGHDHDPFEGYPIREGMAQGVADNWYNTIYEIVQNRQRLENKVGDPIDALVQKDSQDRFKTDPEKWLWSLRGEDVLGGESIDPKMLTSALNAQGIDPHAFRRFHYLGVDDPDNPIVPDEVYEGYWSGTFDRDSKDINYDSENLSKEDTDYLLEKDSTRVIKGVLGEERFRNEGGQRAKWVKELNALIEGKESGQYPESVMKVFDEGIEQSRNIIAKFDELFGYNAEEDKLRSESNLTEAEYQMLQDIKNKPEGQRLPFEREALLKLESRRRWGTEFDVWSGLDVWPNDDDIPF